MGDAQASLGALRYYAGWADKISGYTCDVDDASKHVTVRKEPIGVGELLEMLFSARR
jgi:acyl-CoA reductase-like NAD-dependent aldehyde dehydrogenase